MRMVNALHLPLLFFLRFRLRMSPVQFSLKVRTHFHDFCSLSRHQPNSPPSNTSALNQRILPTTPNSALSIKQYSPSAFYTYGVHRLQSRGNYTLGFGSRGEFSLPAGIRASMALARTSSRNTHLLRRERKIILSAFFDGIVESH